MSTIKLNSEQQAFVEDNMGLAGFMAKKLQNHSPVEFEELMSLCHLGLVIAVQKFDKDRGVKFFAFASRVIQNVVFIENRSYKKRQNDMYLEDLLKGVSAKDPDSLSWESLIEDKSKPIDEQIIDRLLIQQLSTRSMTVKLTAKEKQVLKFLLANPEANQYELASHMGYSQPHVSRTIKSMRKKLLAQLAG